VTACGGDGADMFTDGLGSDFLGGGAGDDLLQTGAVLDGADVFDGGDGTDTMSYALRTSALVVDLLNQTSDGEPGEHDDVRSTIENAIGGSGDDVLSGTEAKNGLDGSLGNDTLIETAGSDTLIGGEGDDTFVQSAVPFGTRMRGGPGFDLVSYDARTASVTITLCSDESGATCTANNGEPGEQDLLAGIEGVEGGTGNDTINGSELDDTIFGGDGDDYLEGGAGNDSLFGDDGDDVLLGGEGDDYLDDSSGSNQLDAGEGEGDICICESAPAPVGCELY
jgi:Ca2+-binding RTX toxin-like protein